MNKISRLYPQYQFNNDRRKNNIPVPFERRSGRERRSEDRIMLDSRLTRDIYQVKEQAAKLESLAPKLFSRNVSIHQPDFLSKNNLEHDQFLRASKPDMTEKIRQEAKSKFDTGLKIGIVSGIAAGITALAFLGPIGAAAAAGSVFYIILSASKKAAEAHLKDVSEKEGN